jgi:putative transposase
MPTLKAIWGPKGQQVMIPTPAQPKKRYGIGAVDYHTGESVVLIRRRKRRREVSLSYWRHCWRSTRGG